MKITDVRIQLIKAPKNKLVAFATITLDEALVIKDFQIFTSVRGYFVGMPSRKLPDGTWREQVFSLSSEFSDYLCSNILRAFEDELHAAENHIRYPEQSI
ncbi:MAG: SpoVG family protein [Candidatus Riflebacteria bacterium]|jgi:stage V sporulation protein G|nr:SpoVG family protein [Candidatus Riflebacteria bacterium]